MPTSPRVDSQLAGKQSPGSPRGALSPLQSPRGIQSPLHSQGVRSPTSPHGAQSTATSPPQGLPGSELQGVQGIKASSRLKRRKQEELTVSHVVSSTDITVTKSFRGPRGMRGAMPPGGMFGSTAGSADQTAQMQLLQSTQTLPLFESILELQAPKLRGEVIKMSKHIFRQRARQTLQHPTMLMFLRFCMLINIIAMLVDVHGSDQSEAVKIIASLVKVFCLCMWVLELILYGVGHGLGLEGLSMDTASSVEDARVRAVLDVWSPARFRQEKVTGRSLMNAALPLFHNPSTVVDFVLVVSSIVGYTIPGGNEGNGFNRIRYLHGLKSLRLVTVMGQHVPTVSHIISGLSLSTAMLTSSATFLIFFFILFGVMGVDQWKGKMNSRCVLPDPHNATFQQPIALAVGNITRVLYPNETDYTRHVCQPTPWSSIGPCVETIPATPCSTAMRSSFFDSIVCLAPTICTEVEPVHYGYTSFDTIYNGLLTMFQVTSLSNWAEILHRMAAGTSFLLCGIFSVALIITLNFIILNFFAAVVTSSYAKARETGKKARKKASHFGSMSRFSISRIADDVLHFTFPLSIIQALRMTVEEGGEQIKVPVYKHPAMRSFISVVIFTHVTLHAINGVHMPAEYPYYLRQLDIIVVLFYIFEFLLSVVSAGSLARYFRSSWRKGESVMLLLAIIGLIVEVPLSLVRSIRVIRVLRLLPFVSKGQLTSRSLKTTGPAVIVSVFIFLCIFVMAGVAIQLFSEQQDSLPETPTELTVPNFNSFNGALKAIFVLLTADDWEVLMYRGMRIQHWIMGALFYIPAYLMFSYLLASLFTAVVLDTFDPPDIEKHIHQKRESEKERRAALQAEKDREKQRLHLTEMSRSSSVSKLSKKHSSSSFHSASAAAAAAPVSAVEYSLTVNSGNRRRQSLALEHMTKAKAKTASNAEASRRAASFGQRHTAASPISREESGLHHSETSSVRFAEVGKADSEQVLRRQQSGLTTSSEERVAAATAGTHSSSDTPHEGGTGGGGEKPNPSASRSRLIKLTDPVDPLEDTATKPHGMLSSSDVISYGDEDPDGGSGGTRGKNKKKDNSDKSFFFIHQDNPIRRIICKMVISRDDLDAPPEDLENLATYGHIFHWIIVVIVILSCLQVAIEPATEACSNKKEQSIVSAYEWELDWTFIAIFTAEMLLKMVAHGVLLRGKKRYWWLGKPYLRDAWNLLDVALLIAMFISVFYPATKALRIVRTLRPLRVVRKIETMRDLVHGVLRSLPNILLVFLSSTYVIFLFAMIGTSMFAGKMNFCSATRLNGFEVSRREECTGVFFSPMGSVAQSAEWQTHRANFDNVGNAMMFLVETTSLSEWNRLMSQALDIVGVDRQPVPNYSASNVWFFFIFILVTSYFIVNLFVGILLLSLDEYRGVLFLTTKQRDWKTICKEMGKLLPFKPLVKTPFPRIQRVVIQPWFDFTVNVLVIMNVIVIATTHHNQTQDFTKFQFYSNVIFVACFFIEAVLKIMAFKHTYFHSNWNLVDFAVVLGSTFELFYQLGTDNQGDVTITSVGRGFRILRILKSVRRVRSLKSLFHTLVMSLPSILSISSFLVLYLFIYSVVALQQFGNIRNRELIGDLANFRRLDKSIITLFQMVTLDRWNLIMAEAGIQQPFCTSGESVWWYRDGPEDDPAIEMCGQVNDCGDPFVEIFFVSFYAIGVYMFISIVVAVMLDNFNYISTQARVDITVDSLEDYAIGWRDAFEKPNFDSYIPEDKLSDLVRFLFNNNNTLVAGLTPDSTIHPVLTAKSRMNFKRFQYEVLWNASREDVEHYEDGRRRLSFHNVLVTLGIMQLGSGSLTRQERRIRRPLVEQQRTYLVNTILKKRLPEIIAGIRRRVSHSALRADYVFPIDSPRNTSHRGDDSPIDTPVETPRSTRTKTGLSKIELLQVNKAIVHDSVPSSPLLDIHSNEGSASTSLPAEGQHVGAAAAPRKVASFSTKLEMDPEQDRKHHNKDDDVDDDHAPHLHSKTPARLSFTHTKEHSAVSEDFLENETFELEQYPTPSNATYLRKQREQEQEQGPEQRIYKDSGLSHLEDDRNKGVVHDASFHEEQVDALLKKRSGGGLSQDTNTFSSHPPIPHVDSLSGDGSTNFETSGKRNSDELLADGRCLHVTHSGRSGTWSVNSKLTATSGDDAADEQSDFMGDQLRETGQDRMPRTGTLSPANLPQQQKVIANPFSDSDVVQKGANTPPMLPRSAASSPPIQGSTKPPTPETTSHSSTNVSPSSRNYSGPFVENPMRQAFPTPSVSTMSASTTPRTYYDAYHGGAPTYPQGRALYDSVRADTRYLGRSGTASDSSSTVVPSEVRPSYPYGTAADSSTLTMHSAYSVSTYGSQRESDLYGTRATAADVSGVPSCREDLSCSSYYDPVHSQQYAHTCRDGKRCRKVGNPLHRAYYRH